MSLLNHKQFSHLLISNLNNDGTPQVIIAADATKDRILDFLRVTSNGDAQGADWALVFTLSDTGAANPREVGKSDAVLSAANDAVIFDMCARGTAREDGVQHKAEIGSFGASSGFIPMDGLFIPAGAQVAIYMDGGDAATDDFNIVASGREKVVA